MSGWWTALGTTERNEAGRTAAADAQTEQNGVYVIEGSLGEGLDISRFGTSIREPAAFKAGDTVPLIENTDFTLSADGRYRWTSPTLFEHERGKRVFYVTTTPPTFTLANYVEVLTSEGVGQSFINSLTVDAAGYGHPDPDRSLRCLCLRLDGIPCPAPSCSPSWSAYWWCRFRCR